MSNATISRELLAKIVDEVFDGAIEDASVIEEIYASIKRHEAGDRHCNDPCPICAVAFVADDICATDIELGTCHAACLEGSPIVDLETGGEIEGGKVDTFRYGENASSLPTADVFSISDKGNSITLHFSEIKSAKRVRDAFAAGRLSIIDHGDTPPPLPHLMPGEAEKIALLEERISSLEDELYEARQVPWPDWATTILRTLQKYGYDPVVDGEVDLGEAFKDYLEGITQDEEQDKKRFREVIERAQAIISTATYPNWHATARAALATATEGSGE